MVSFDFITDARFRNVLESDYRELDTAMQASCWKAAQVLAGSILEAVLSDSLLAAGEAEAQVLKMFAKELIERADQLGLLSVRALQLSEVIKDYRNIIHPGRIERMQEIVDEDSATVARSLLRIVVQDVRSKRQNILGTSAAQIVDKLTSDPDAVAILDELIAELNVFERKRLLLEVLPMQLFTVGEDRHTIPAVIDALGACFRTVFDAESSAVKEEVARLHVKFIKKESTANVNLYEFHLFKPEHLLFYSPIQRQTVLKRFAGLWRNNWWYAALALEALPFLPPADATQLLSALLNLFSNRYHEAERLSLTLAKVFETMDQPLRSLTMQRLSDVEQEVRTNSFPHADEQLQVIDSLREKLKSK